MIIVYGTRFYGRVKESGRSFLATRFLHIWYLPLIPMGTQLVLEDNGGSYKGMAAPFSFKSMLAAYLRVWGPVAIIFAIVSCVSTLGDYTSLETVVLGAFLGLVTLVLVAAVILSFAVLGKLSHDEKRQRAVYALHVGYHVDPADLGDARHNFRQALLGTIMERARGMAAMGYRMNADPAVAWPHVALDPTHNDEALITAAFTLSRLEASMNPGPGAFQMEQVHNQLWQRISRSNAPYLNVPA